MNIFALDECPYKSAFALPDTLLVKMTTESSHILATALRYHNVAYKDTKINFSNLPMRVMGDLPVVLWAKKDLSNFCWLLNHACALSFEYQQRYGKPHNKLPTIKEIFNWYIRLFGEEHFLLDKYTHTDFVMVMPEQYKSKEATDSYKIYIQMEKSRYSTWRYPSRKPRWWKMDCPRHRISGGGCA